MRTRSSRSAFTLLELVVVLGILAVVTVVAVRSVDGLGNERLYAASIQQQDDLRASVLGAPTDTAPDGTSAVKGFVADMGRLPKTRGGAELDLSELWENSGPVYGLRPADEPHGVLGDIQDPEVFVPGGWRGPYVRFPLGQNPNLIDAWGNRIVSFADGDTTHYSRLRDALDQPIATPGQPVRIIRNLGANGIRNVDDVGIDQDRDIVFRDSDFVGSAEGFVEFVKADPSKDDAIVDTVGTVIVRVFGPNPDDANLIKVTASQPVGPVNVVDTKTVRFAISGLVQGTRVIRAYFRPDGDTEGVRVKKSAVKLVTLRPGVNVIGLTIYR